MWDHVAAVEAWDSSLSTPFFVCTLLVTLFGASLMGAGCSNASSSAEVTIHRDEWGVPHIYGPTDASVIFGGAYAQAEDNWPQVEENFARAIGRGAELFGDEALVDDFLVHGMEIPERSIAEYQNASQKMRELYDAFAAGFNHFLDRNPALETRLLDRVEPWYTLALIRFKYHHNEYLGYAGLKRSHTLRLMQSEKMGAVDATDLNLPNLASAAWPPGRSAPNGERSLGSNQWAVAGSRTASGYPMLLINPHVSFFGLSTYTEVHFESDTGLEFSGLTRFGFMLPYMGNNSTLGWAYTDNYGDHSDLYLETVDRDAKTYLYGDEWRDLRTWTDTVSVVNEGIRSQHVFRYEATHHGPILGVTDEGRPLSARLAKLDEGGWFEQWAGMIKSTSLAEWRESAALLNVPYMNTMYADRDGNILYIYNHAIPRRSEAYDWSAPVDGSTPATEWNGYHTLKELPQYLNPPAGFLQNTNSDPFFATDGIDDSRDDYPSYMVGNEADNFRSQRSRQVLRNFSNLTLDGFARAVLDTRLLAADEWLDRLLQSVDDERSRDPAQAADLEGPSAALANWNRESSKSSVATTLFVLWAERAAPYSTSNTGKWVDALEEVVTDLKSTWGTWQIPWGDINRLQRPDASGRAPFNDDLESLSVTGAPGWLGSVYTFTSRPSEHTLKRYGVHGNSFVKVVEFKPNPEARSIFVFGQSGDPDAPHYFDQARLYSNGQFKPAWFDRKNVRDHTSRVTTVQFDEASDAEWQ